MQTMRVEVEGNELFLTFHISGSTYFRLNGNDVHTDAVISLSQAVLGGTIKVEGIYGDESIVITPGTDSHSKIRLLNKGVKRTDGYGYGDHYVNIKIEIPKKLSEKQYSLMKAFAELEDNTRGTITGVKKRENITESDDYSAKEDNTGTGKPFPLVTIMKNLWKKWSLKSSTQNL